MSHNVEYYDKYLKYKNKYLKLKELLGGMDPRTFNNLPGNQRDRTQLHQLYLMISNLLTDMIVYLVLQKYNLESTFITLTDVQKQQIEDNIYSAFLKIKIKKKNNLRNTIYEIIKYTLEKRMETGYAPPDADKNQTTYMYMFGMKLEYLNSGQFDTNVHISCQRTGNSSLYYHLSVSHRKKANSPPVSVHFTDESAIFNELKVHRIWYNERYFQNIILGIAAINFGVTDTTRDNLKQILINITNSPALYFDVNWFLIELLDYINTYLYTNLINDIDLDDIIKDEVMTMLSPMSITPIATPPTPPTTSIASLPIATPIVTTSDTPSSPDDWEAAGDNPVGGIQFRAEYMAAEKAEEIKAKQAKQAAQELKIATKIQNRKQTLSLTDFLRYLQAKTTKKIETSMSKL